MARELNALSINGLLESKKKPSLSAYKPGYVIISRYLRTSLRKRNVGPSSSTLRSCGTLDLLLLAPR